MSFLQAMQIVGTGLKVASALKGGRDVSDQASFDRYQLELKMNQEEIAGRERMNARNAQFAANEAVNRAMFFSGLSRDPSDRSVKAFLAKQAEIAGDDVSAIGGQTAIGVSQLGVQKAALTAQEKSAYQSALLGATSAVASGLFAYEEYRTEGSLFGDT